MFFKFGLKTDPGLAISRSLINRVSVTVTNDYFDHIDLCLDGYKLSASAAFDSVKDFMRLRDLLERRKSILNSHKRNHTADWQICSEEPDGVSNKELSREEKQEMLALLKQLRNRLNIPAKSIRNSSGLN